MMDSGPLYSTPFGAIRWTVVNDLTGKCLYCGCVGPLSFGLYENDDRPYRGACAECFARESERPQP